MARTSADLNSSGVEHADSARPYPSCTGSATKVMFIWRPSLFSIRTRRESEFLCPSEVFFRLGTLALFPIRRAAVVVRFGVIRP